MKTNFYSMYFVLVMLVLPCFTNGQNSNEDVIYLKNGTVIHGLILEQIPNQSIKIMTKENKIVVYQMDEILKTTKEPSQSDVTPTSKKRSPSGRLRNAFMGFYMGVDFSSMSPDAQAFCNETASAMNSLQGFKNFNLSPSSRTGFELGFSYYGRIKGGLFLQTELAYISRGMVVKGQGQIEVEYGNYSTVTLEQRIKLNYLKVPFYVKYYFFTKGSRVKSQDNFNFYLMAGPGVGLAVGRNLQTIVSVSGNSNDQTSDVKDYFKPYDFTLDFGGGIEIFKMVNLEFRYDLGLVNAVEEGASSAVLKNGSFSINLGCSFPL